MRGWCLLSCGWLFQGRVATPRRHIGTTSFAISGDRLAGNPRERSEEARTMKKLQTKAFPGLLHSLIMHSISEAMMRADEESYRLHLSFALSRWVAMSAD